MDNWDSTCLIIQVQPLPFALLGVSEIRKHDGMQVPNFNQTCPPPPSSSFFCTFEWLQRCITLEEGAEREDAISRITTVVQGVGDSFKHYNC